MTVWGIYRDKYDLPKIMLMYAWKDRVQLHSLVHEIAKICKKYKADKLIIEGKASGISVAQEIRRLFTNEEWGIQLINPKGDKLARLMSVEPLFSGSVVSGSKDTEKTSGGLVFAPEKAWADMVITEVEKFPKAKHDDLTDTVSMALKFLRENGLAVRREEREVDLERQMMHTGHSEPIYDC